MSSAEIPSQQKSSAFIAFCAVIISLMTPFAMDGYTPSLPALTHAFGCTENEIQLTISLFLLGAAFAQLFYGPLSDRFGRRNIVLVGVSICILGGILAAISPTPTALIVARFIQGAGAGASNTLYRAILRDIYSGSRLAQMASRFSIIYTVGWAVAPLLGGYIQEIFNWRGNLITAVLFATFSLLLVLKYLPETNMHKQRNATKLRVMIENYQLLLSNRAFVGGVLCSSLTLSGVITYISMAPFLLENTLGLTPVEYGWSAILLAVGLAIGNLLNSTFVPRFGMLRMLLLGTIIMTISGTVLSITGLVSWVNVYAIVIPAFCFAAGAGFVYANAMSNAFEAFSEIAGSGAAIYGFLQMLGTFLISMWIVELRDEDQATMGMVLLTVGIVALLAFYFFLRPRREQLQTNI